MKWRTVTLSCSLALLVSALVGSRPLAAETTKLAEHSADHHVVENPGDGTQIALTVFKPAAAAGRDVPVVLHSHGWGGSRSKTISGTIRKFLDAGMGVVSIDQRGHGESTGEAHVQDPTRETEDIKAVIDYVAGLEWVLHDRAADGSLLERDPVLGAIGGSYGGGYQTMTALDEIADEGRTRFNALAPEITWYDLPESLAPNKVVRTAWVTALYAAGAPNVPQYIHEGFAWGAATGQWPDGTILGKEVQGVPNIDKEFHKHAPEWFVERGFQLDVPILLRQGTSDNLFNLNQGLHIFERALSDTARANSFFIAYNGGHALPNAAPPGTAVGSDACTPGGDFTKLTIEFFERVFAQRSTDGLLPARYNLTDAAGDSCYRSDRLTAGRIRKVALPGAKDVITPNAAGPPLHLEIAKGGDVVAGIPVMTGTVTTTSPDARAFFGLALGTTPADARVIQNNLLPLRRELPVTDDKFSMELPGVSVTVPDGQRLFLTVTPLSDMYFGHGSRVPGAMLLENLRVSLPVAQPAAG